MSGAAGADALASAARAVAGRLLAPAVTALVADPADPDGVDAALAALLPALRGAGVPAGRVFVLVAHRAGEPLGPAGRARLARHGVPVLVHDPARSPTCRFGRAASGAAIVLDDELREAEAVVLLGPVTRAAGAALGGSDLLAPGLAPAGAAAVAPQDAARAVGVDAVLLWTRDAAGRRTWWAGGAEAEAAAHAAAPA